MQVRRRGIENVLEVLPKATALLEGLRKHLILVDVAVRHRATRELHRLFKVLPGDAWHEIVRIVFLHPVASLGPFTFAFNVPLNVLADRKLDCTLADLGQVGTREPEIRGNQSESNVKQAYDAR
jgi:hypothetical protein